MACSSLPSSPVVVGKKYVDWSFPNDMPVNRYAERTNKGEVVVKHGVEDGWEAGCKATVRLAPGMTGRYN